MLLRGTIDAIFTCDKDMGKTEKPAHGIHRPRKGI
jgi:hypothetical protein